jgi:hypothetical protein
MAKRGVASDMDWLQPLQGVMSGGTFEYTLSLRAFTRFLKGRA